MVSTMNAMILQRQYPLKHVGNPTQRKCDPCCDIGKNWEPLNNLVQTPQTAKWMKYQTISKHPLRMTHARSTPSGEHSILPMEIKLQTKRKTWKYMDENSPNWGTRPHGLMTKGENSYWFWYYFFLKHLLFPFFAGYANSDVSPTCQRSETLCDSPHGCIGIGRWKDQTPCQ